MLIVVVITFSKDNNRQFLVLCIAKLFKVKVSTIIVCLGDFITKTNIYTLPCIA